VREVGRIAGEEEWQEIVYNRKKMKKLLRKAKNRRILHMAVELLNELPTAELTYLYNLVRY
jgi:hypothetical protein